MRASPVSEFVLKAYHLVVAPRIDREIRRALALSQEMFPASIALPAPFGKGMNERVVEILIARLTYGPGKKILDVGHANAMKAHLRMVQSLPRPIDITGIDITPASDAVRWLYTRSVTQDVTKTDFHDGAFDLIWCISAIEHFGMDNSLYTDRFALGREMDIRALEEMMRVLHVGGTLYISVPFGNYEDHGWLRNYDTERWQKLLAIARPNARIDELYFKYSDGEGWRCADPGELSGVGYRDHQNSGASGLAAALVQKSA
jgi:SAM-dependent methyltransferase